MPPDGTGDAAATRGADPKSQVRPDGGTRGATSDGDASREERDASAGAGASAGADASEVPERVTTLARAGALASLVLAVVVAAPAVLVTGAGSALGDFYTAGPFGLTAVGFLAVVAVVVFLSVTQGHTDTALLTGVALVVSLAAFLLAVVWALTLDETLLFGFPAEYAWLETYRWVVVVAAGVVAAVGGLLTGRVL